IAGVIGEQMAPIKPCCTSFDVLRIAWLDMAGDLLERRSMVLAQFRQDRSLIENLAADSDLPQPVLERLLRLRLQSRHRSLTMMAVERQRETGGGVTGIGEDHRHTSLHASGNQGASQRCMRRVDDDPRKILDDNAHLAIVSFYAALAVGEREPGGLS